MLLISGFGTERFVRYLHGLVLDSRLFVSFLQHFLVHQVLGMKDMIIAARCMILSAE